MRRFGELRMARILPVRPGRLPRPDCGAPGGALGSNSDRRGPWLGGRRSALRLEPDIDHLQLILAGEAVYEFDVLALAFDDPGHVSDVGSAFGADLEVVVRRGAGRVQLEALDAGGKILLCQLLLERRVHEVVVGLVRLPGDNQPGEVVSKVR